MNSAALVIGLSAVVACGGDPTTEPDAGRPPDAGLDAGPDAGLDAGLDAGELDAGELDAGELDAGELDAGELDAGELDAGEDGGTDGGVVVDCGRDTFSVPVGWPCNEDEDCAGGRCRLLDSGVGYCTTLCTRGGGECPRPMTCLASGDSGECVLPAPVVASLAPAGALQALAPCWTDADCAGRHSACASAALPGATRANSYCASTCAPGPGACGACGVCDSSVELGGTFCRPQGPRTLGEACGDHLECASLLCLGFCSSPCGAGSACPPGAACRSLDAMGLPANVCVPAALDLAGAEGTSCHLALECRTGLRCLSGPDGGRCGAPRGEGGSCSSDADCESPTACVAAFDGGAGTCRLTGALGAACVLDSHCETGLTCRGLGPLRGACTKACDEGCGDGAACLAPDMDTELVVYAESAGMPVRWASNDDEDGAGLDRWSRLSPRHFAPGTYWVELRNLSLPGLTPPFVGRYRLELAGAGAPGSTYTESGDALPTRNDATTFAEPLPDPRIVVDGAFDTTDDVDTYRIVVPAGGLDLAVRVGRGSASMCAPSTLVGNVALGGECLFEHACASGTCEGRVGRCGRACAADVECGAGFRCAEVAGRRTCLDEARVATLARGAACTASFECADGYCARFGGARACTSRCESAACPSGSECTSLEVWTFGAISEEKACVPVGSGRQAFHAACALSSDCADGSCVDGTCQHACEADEDCPGSTIAADLPDPLCDACEGAASCGPGGACLPGEGAERFCAVPCGDGDACPDGFTCSTRWGAPLCLPAHGSCRATACALPAGEDAGRCIVPHARLGDACSGAAECTTRACEGGLCASACTGDADCGCANGDLACSAGRCGPTEAGVREEEGSVANGAPRSAVPLGAITAVRVFGELRTRDGFADRDVYALALVAGDLLEATIRAVCDAFPSALDTRLRVLDGQGRVLHAGGLASGPDELAGFEIASTGEYFVEVSDEGGSPLPESYVLSLAVR